MQRFVPKRAVFEPRALEYSLGQRLYKQLQDMGVPISMTPSHNRVPGIPGKNPQQAYSEAKQTLVVGVRKTTDFASCKPSAHFQLPLATSCPGMCEYCYLATTLGKRPYLRVYVNVEEILAKVKEYIDERAPDLTVFEGAATSDPIPTEYLTGLLQTTIEFFAGQTLGRFRFVTKFTDVDSLLAVKHNGHTRFRFSLNADTVIKAYEHHTPAMEERVSAAARVAAAGYPTGFIIAPIFYFPGWQEQYEKLLSALDKRLSQTMQHDITFELITHRFTKRAQANIMDIYPQTVLPMNEEGRKFKFGQFGYGKYVYEKEIMDEMKTFILERLESLFPKAKIEYFV